MIKPLFAGNWKMHKTPREAKDFFIQFSKFKEIPSVDIVLCPPFTSLPILSELVDGEKVQLGAQNCHFEDKGAFTGEISPPMLKDFKCKYIILGHSERRKIFMEDDGFINKKVISAQRHGFIPILCVGETIEERNTGKTNDVIDKQLTIGLKDINSDKEIIIAYEPVWAIGSGLAATPKDAETVIAFIRNMLKDLIGANIAKKTRILYGGSVKPSNIKELMEQDNINGALVGGASLDPGEFYQLIVNGMEL